MTRSFKSHFASHLPRYDNQNTGGNLLYEALTIKPHQIPRDSRRQCRSAVEPLCALADPDFFAEDFVVFF